jgi:hypothetical protein
LNAFDYYDNPEILSAIKLHESRIKCREDREDCRQEIYAELYDFMPLDISEAVKIIDRVGIKFRRGRQSISDHEISYAEAGIQ